jgi:hypothetical protein
MSSGIIKRLEALERRIVAKPVTLINVWTQSLADRIEPMLPKGRGCRLVTLTFGNQEAENAFEASLREVNTKEAARLDALLKGQIP